MAATLRADGLADGRNQGPIRRIIWSPGQNRAQWALLGCPVFEVFFGGARGGGKTDGMLGEWISHAGKYGENAIGLMLRRSRTELVETIERSRAIYAPLRWTLNETEKMWRAPNGARLRFNYLERDADAELYQGHSYTRIYVEEAGNFPNAAPILKLMATLRSGAGVPVGMRLTGNPGGPGHQWVKQRYIDPAPLGNVVITDPLTGLKRVFIPSKVDNNAHIDTEDYKRRLRASGSKELVAAWLEGDWSVTLGAFFDCWQASKHIVQPFPVPDDWMRFRSMDWGSASPFSIGWWAIVSDDYSVDGRILPRGCMVRYREWYGMTPGQPNVGLKLHAEEVAKGIVSRETSDKIAYGVLDPSAFIQDGGPSLAERMGTSHGVYFRRADNSRVSAKGMKIIGGWDMMRARLVGDGDGRPMLVVFSTCVDFIRTVPFLQHDPDKNEDVLTDSEDHAGDECRYACMSRPWIPHKEPPKPENVSGYKVARETAVPDDWKSI
jgi:Terminase large subunit, T4likevirus-type, N-terminal